MKRSPPRYSPLRKRSILIQCEGSRTEPRYLNDFSQQCGASHRLNVRVRPGKGQNALVTVQEALTEGKRKAFGINVYDEVWCVLDVEHAAHADNLTEAIALAQKNDVLLILSHPSFEVWLLCHFERPTKWFEKSKAAEDHLTAAYWKKHFGCPYEKSDPELYERLKDRVGDAVANARYIQEEHDGLRTCRSVNPSTDVYKLVERLLQG